MGSLTDNLTIESSARAIYLQKERKPAAVGSFPPVVDKLDEASDALKQKLYEKVKVAQESVDKSEFGWATVNEYLSDELASDSDDEKRIYRAERKINKEKRRRVRSDEKGSGSSSVHCAASSSRFSSKDLASRSEARPARRLGPCFKISSLLFLVILALFLLCRLWRYTQAIIQYSL
ncbi:unnamed protein product [Pocillopora meandrina]|uniref:Uncharacterized protein n=1 Tax=Pocillopora meandrina TaxID=46732 RepID=A0AAU9Y3D0_9CNID|nr:unnamed protein product [Pocillopora meandrina]